MKDWLTELDKLHESGSSMSYEEAKKKYEKYVIKNWTIGFIMLVCGFIALVTLHIVVLSVTGGIMVLIGLYKVWIASVNGSMDNCNFRYVSNTFWALLVTLFFIVLIVGTYVK